MRRKALKVVTELHFRRVSCPGVHLGAKHDLYLSVCVMGQHRASLCGPAGFPLILQQKMTIEKIFRFAVDPGDIAVMMEYETVKIDLVQLTPPDGYTLAWFEEDSRHFLFPEPKLVPSSTGRGREVLMTRAPDFPGIAPRLEFWTCTSICECPALAESHVYPNVPTGPRPSRRPASRTRKERAASPRRRPGTAGPGGGGGGGGGGGSSSESDAPIGRRQEATPPALPSSRSRCGGRPPDSWEEVQQRVRRLLTTPRAVRRLLFGSTVSELQEEVPARRSVSPPP